MGVFNTLLIGITKILERPLKFLRIQYHWHGQRNLPCVTKSSSSSGVPKPQARDRYRSGPQPVRNGAAQQEVSSGGAREASSDTPHHSHYLLNNPPAPFPSAEKLSSTKSVPGAKNVGDRCSS